MHLIICIVFCFSIVSSSNRWGWHCDSWRWHWKEPGCIKNWRWSCWKVMTFDTTCIVWDNCGQSYHGQLTSIKASKYSFNSLFPGQPAWAVMRGRKQRLKDTGVRLWIWLCLRRVCHEEIERERYNRWGLQWSRRWYGLGMGQIKGYKK